VQGRTRRTYGRDGVGKNSIALRKREKNDEQKRKRKNMAVLQRKPDGEELGKKKKVGH